MQCTSPIQLDNMGIFVPCGKCRACRIAKASEWAARMLHESEYHDHSIFATLTYSDATLPSNLELFPRHLTLFFKSLRKALSPRLIKYFACGEYGEHTARPHYHAAIFGFKPCYSCYSCCTTSVTNDTPSDDCKLIRSAWIHGHVDIKPLTYKSARYVANYLLKAPNIQKGRTEKPFTRMSNGIGKQWCLDHIEQLKTTCSYRIDGVEKTLPKYYVDQIQEADPNWEPDLKFQTEEAIRRYTHYQERYPTTFPDNTKRNAAVRAHRAQTEKNMIARDSMKRKSNV